MKQLSLLEQARLREPARSDFEHIEVIASDTIRELGETAPVDLEVVASYHGIRAIDFVPLPMSGCLIPESDSVRMLLNSTDSRPRRRFTGFHEVGHSFQPGYRKQKQFRCQVSARPRRTPDTEALSDTAGAALLLPRDEFRADVLASGFGISTVANLAEHYVASIQATGYRFQTFWPEPTLLVVLEQGWRREEHGDPTAPSKLRVVSAYSHGRWPYIPKNKSASTTGPLARAYAGEFTKEHASLDDLAPGQSPDGLEVSARVFSYRKSDGEFGKRVVAIYRKLASGSVAN
jgi:hypothetical protein